MKKIIFISAIIFITIISATACKTPTPTQTQKPTGSPTPTPTGTINLVPDPTPSTGLNLPSLPKDISVVDGELQVTVYIVESGEVKTMPLETYIQGVVAGEVKADWPAEALKAQAVLARTYVLQFIKEKGMSKYGNAQVSTDITEAQAWSDDVSQSIKDAVNATKGQIVAYNGDFIMSWFHSNSGGQTALAKEGLNYEKDEPAYIKSTASPDTGAPADEKEWEATFTLEKFKAACTAAGYQLGNITSVAIGDKADSGRAINIKVNGTKIPATVLRINLSSTEMKSTLLTQIQVGDGMVYIAGKGYGHGVGMSQWGACALANDGKSVDEILNYYFKNINIGKIY